MVALLAHAQVQALAEEVHALSALTAQLGLLAGRDGLHLLVDLVDTPPKVPLFLEVFRVEEVKEAD